MRGHFESAAKYPIFASMQLLHKSRTACSYFLPKSTKKMLGGIEI